ncbi:2-amino-4-hydroxy-6-hydroxymethyldihydropteridine diphosphokinase [Methylobacterium pseudosasicola]|uniref:2-amino-4-hydroxy-6-hydroxymethyldihydropteridine pyrophosphokinase n=1 Tax=Methylobacterium pseudosasicola TaxID=582667 RepID=A0A1I4QRF9_9HYPH|nr:2-amino-4-hydroxy-6-hydroxymethyldihydropteridine diphosphokinase [Methylobacterium pseudosasicola]SFM42652.1 2-amino-4-hydroxy-6-hydroxymethyldihydropteridinediphosphokinase [Methylobacterium pseudosasicola]
MRAYLGIGSNIGDMAQMLDRAVAGLAATPGIHVVARSSDYRTPPWGKTDQPWFLNGAVAVDTDLDPHGLLDACLSVERDLGRLRAERWGPRVIDIDVLAYEGAAVDDDRLVLPHRHVRERAFVLVPLAEIAPDLVIAGERVVDALAKLDQSGITRV